MVRFALSTLTQHLYLILLARPSFAVPAVSVRGPRVRLTTGLIEGFYNGSMDVFLGEHPCVGFGASLNVRTKASRTLGRRSTSSAFAHLGLHSATPRVVSFPLKHGQMHAFSL